MSLRVLCRGLLAVAVLAATAGAAFAQAPAPWAPFYAEVPKDGRIYVFAIGQRYDTFQKSGGAEIGVAITRPGYGPNGETVVFDSESAINLYNFKHNLAGEYFPPPKVTPPSPYPAGKFSGLMFGDYYAYDKWHQNTISATNTNNVQGQQGFWFRRIYFTYDLTFSEKFTTRVRLEANSNGQFQSPGNINPYIKDAYLKWSFWNKQVLTLGMNAQRPVKLVLADARAGGKGLTPNDWKLLAFYSWETDEQQIVAKDQTPVLLKQLAAACPADQADTANRLLLKSVAMTDAKEARPDPAVRDKVLNLLIDTVDAVVHDLPRMATRNTMFGPSASHHLDLVRLHP